MQDTAVGSFLRHLVELYERHSSQSLPVTVFKIEAWKGGEGIKSPTAAAAKDAKEKKEAPPDQVGYCAPIVYCTSGIYHYHRIIV